MTNFDPAAERPIPIAIPANDANAETGIHPITTETEISKCSM